jgi:hypothetical protein
MSIKHRFDSSMLRQSSRLTIAALLAASVATARAQPALSRISGITLYPGGATIERQVPLPAGSARIEVACLPASFDAQTLRLAATSGVQLGDFRI